MIETNKVITHCANTFPKAEWDKATRILMHTPEMVLFDGVIHPAAGLFKDYFNINDAISEHLNYIKMLESNGIQVYTLEDILRSLPHDKLIELAEPALTYDGTKTSQSPSEIETYRQEVLSKMCNEDLVRVILNRPGVILDNTSINTGVKAIYTSEPLMNIYFTRDQSITTPKGHIMCRMNSSQRFPEVDVVETCYKAMGEPAIYRINGETSYLEGGDYIPAGDFAIIGQGLRTSQEAIDELLQNDLIGHNTLVVVRDSWKNQYQMHLDTYFNIIDKDLCTLCFNRYDAEDKSDINFLSIDVYSRKDESSEYCPVPEYSGYSFKQFLIDKGFTIIRINKEDADRYANNYLTIGARHIMAVAGQSQEYQDALSENNVTVEWVPLDNLTCGYGASHCMTQVLERI